MTRLEAKEFLISLGVAEPDDTAITNYLNTVNGEIQKERSKAEQYKKDSEKVAELQAQLDAINSQNMTDLEKSQKETQAANDRIAALEKQIKESNIRKGLAEKGVSGEDADKFVSALMEGTFDVESFGNIFEAGKKSAVSEYEKKSLGSTPNPNGEGGDGAKTPTEMDKAVDIAKNALCGAAKESTDIINAYK